MEALGAADQLLDAAKVGGKGEDDLNHLMEELSMKINAHIQNIREELKEDRRGWLGEEFGFYEKNTHRSPENLVVDSQSYYVW